MHAYHAQEVLVAIRRMIHGSNIVEAAFSRNESKENKARILTMRRLKYILSNLYAMLSELELSMNNNKHLEADLGAKPDVLKAETLADINRKPSAWQIICRSGRKRFIDYELQLLKEEQLALIQAERRSRSKEYDRKRKEFLMHARAGRDSQIKESLMIKKTMVCRICERKDIPMNKCKEHTKLCRDLINAKHELLQINSWLLQACKDAEELKKDSYKLTKTISKRVVNEGSTRSNEQGAQKEHTCMTPNIRLFSKQTKKFSIGVSDSISNDDTADKDSDTSKKLGSDEARDKFKNRKSNSNEFAEDTRDHFKDKKPEAKKGNEEVSKQLPEKGSADTPSDSDKEDTKAKIFKPSMFRQKYKQPSGVLKPSDTEVAAQPPQTPENNSVVLDKTVPTIEELSTLQLADANEAKDIAEISRSRSKSAGSLDSPDASETSRKSRPLVGEMFDSTSSEEDKEDEKEEFDWQGRSKKVKKSNFLLAQIKKEKDVAKNIKDDKPKIIEVIEPIQVVPAVPDILDTSQANSETQIKQAANPNRTQDAGKKFQGMITTNRPGFGSPHNSEESDGACFGDLLDLGSSSEGSSIEEQDNQSDDGRKKSIYAQQASKDKQPVQAKLTVPSRFSKGGSSPSSPQVVPNSTAPAAQIFQPSIIKVEPVSSTFIPSKNTLEDAELADSPFFIDGLMEDGEDSEKRSSVPAKDDKQSDNSSGQGEVIGLAGNSPLKITAGHVKEEIHLKPENKTPEPIAVIAQAKGSMILPDLDMQDEPDLMNKPEPATKSAVDESTEHQRQREQAWKFNADQRKKFINKSTKKESLTQYQQRKEETTNQESVDVSKEDDFRMVKVARGFLEEIAK